ncbi:MAG: hypothetical protein NW207_12910 [Cytophagales bacterium]|nr:hypothetical protein [Cytophagales bacterium]
MKICNIANKFHKHEKILHTIIIFCTLYVYGYSQNNNDTTSSKTNFRLRVGCMYTGGIINQPNVNTQITYSGSINLDVSADVFTKLGKYFLRNFSWVRVGITIQ